MQVPFQRAVGTIGLAHQFLTAASTWESDEAQQPPLVAHFLLGHALELAFKAVVILHGTTDQALRKIGHDLIRARDAAVDVTPAQTIPLSPQDDARISLLAGYYRAKALEYVELGFMRLPILPELHGTTQRILTAINTYVEVGVRRGLRAGRDT